VPDEIVAAGDDGVRVGPIDQRVALGEGVFAGRGMGLQPLVLVLRDHHAALGRDQGHEGGIGHAACADGGAEAHPLGPGQSVQRGEFFVPGLPL
jgi:hypothetical protein